MTVDNNVVEKIEGLKEGKILICNLSSKPSNITWKELFEFLRDVKVVDLSNASASQEMDAEAGSDTGVVEEETSIPNRYIIDTEIRTLCMSLTNLNIEDLSELQAYKEVIRCINELIRLKEDL